MEKRTKEEMLAYLLGKEHRRTGFSSLSYKEWYSVSLNFGQQFADQETEEKERILFQKGSMEKLLQSEISELKEEIRRLKEKPGI